MNQLRDLTTQGKKYLQFFTLHVHLTHLLRVTSPHYHHIVSYVVIMQFLYLWYGWTDRICIYHTFTMRQHSLLCRDLY